MKRRWIRGITLCLMTTLLFCACEEYKPAVKPSGTQSADSGTATETIETAETHEAPFTVTLTDENGNRYTPPADAPLTVKWYDGFSVHESPMDAAGMASIQGLDGDYQVTLGNLPDGYTYNPNIYKATNDERDVTIQLHKLISTTGRGDQRYQAIEIQDPGVYCVELTTAEQEVFYQFAPKTNGQYVVESWVDTTADTVNPYANYYGANVSYKEFRYTQNDGGASAAYTHNFLLDFAIASESISQNGSAVFTFGVKAGSKTGEYPVKVYFQVRRHDDYSLDHPDEVLIMPTETLVKQPDYPGYTFVGAESEAIAFGNRKIFDGSRYKLYEKSEGGDGYYHLYDAATDTYGPILYAKIASPCRFFEDPFTTVEYHGNKALTLSNGTENYKLFIEGFDYPNSETLSSNPNGKPPYFCSMDCPCRKNMTNDSVEVLGVVGACFDTCEDLYCQEHCRRLPKEMMGMDGYGQRNKDGELEFCNEDGCYAVTPELKDFLQKYSESQRLFMDGNGIVELHETIAVYADDDDQWLFACGYYVPNT